MTLAQFVPFLPEIFLATAGFVVLFAAVGLVIGAGGLAGGEFGKAPLPRIDIRRGLEARPLSPRVCGPTARASPGCPEP